MFYSGMNQLIQSMRIQSRNAHIWLRAECLDLEQRCALVPRDAKTLVKKHGHQVTVERSKQRIFDDEEYEKAGCQLVEEGAWKQLNHDASAPPPIWILGLKTLGKPDPEVLKTHHIYFAHCFKNQAGWQTEVNRFVSGGARIFDLEFMLDPVTRRRVAAFGYHAGYVGMALAFASYYAQLGGVHQLPPLFPFASNLQLFDYVNSWRLKHPAASPKTLILGAKGAAGSGAAAFFSDYLSTVDPLYQKRFPLQLWDVQETKDVASRSEMLRHDILVNCINLQAATVPFVTVDTLKSADRKLSVVSDVSCDVTNPFNPLPIYSEETDFDAAITLAPDTNPPVHVISISHLPSLLPREASTSFSAALLPHLISLPEDPNSYDRAKHPVWTSTLEAFERTVNRLS